jgi:hypothetical protein
MDDFALIHRALPRLGACPTSIGKQDPFQSVCVERAGPDSIST